MIVLTVTWVAKDGHEDEVARIFARLTELSRQEPGCAMFQVHRLKDDARRFFIYEQYRDEAALESHRNTAHFQQLARKELLPIAERVDANLWIPLE